MDHVPGNDSPSVYHASVDDGVHATRCGVPRPAWLPIGPDPVPR